MTSVQMQGSLGGPPFTSPPPLYTSYTLCGSVRPSSGASEQIVVRTWEYTILAGDGSVILTWADPSHAGVVIGLGILGCFGGPIDQVPGRATGTTYRFRINYSGGGKGVVEISGPIGHR